MQEPPQLQQLLQFGGCVTDPQQHKVVPLPRPVFVFPPPLYQTPPLHVRPAAETQLQLHYRSAASLLLLHLHARDAAAAAAANATAEQAVAVAVPAASGWRYSLTYLDGLSSLAALQQADACGGFAAAAKPSAAHPEKATAAETSLPLFAAAVWIDAWPLLQQHAALQQRNRLSLQLALIFAALLLGQQQHQHHQLLLLLELLDLLLQGDSSFCCSALCSLLVTPQPLLLCCRSTIAQHLLPLFLGAHYRRGAHRAAWLLLQHAYTLHATPPLPAAAAAARLLRRQHAATASEHVKGSAEYLPAAAAAAAAAAAGAAGSGDISATAHCLTVLRMLRRHEETAAFISGCPPLAAAVFLVSLRLLSAAAASGSVLLLCREAEQLLLLLWRCRSSRVACLLLGGALTVSTLGDVSRVRLVRAEIWPVLLQPPDAATATQLLAARPCSDSRGSSSCCSGGGGGFCESLTCWKGCCMVAAVPSGQLKDTSSTDVGAKNDGGGCGSTSSSRRASVGEAPLLAWLMCCPPSPRLTELLLPPELLQSLVHLLQQETRQQRLVLQQLQQQLGAGSNSFFGLAGAAAVALSAGSKEGLLQREWFVSRWMPTECCVAAAAATAESMQSSKAPWWASFVGDVAAQVLLWCSTACSLSPSVAGGVQGPSFLRQLQHAQQQQHEDTAAPGQKKPAEEAAAGESVTAPAGAAQAAGYEQLQLCCGALPVLQQLQHATERLPGPYAYLCLLAQRQQLCLRWLLFAAAAAPLPTAAALYPWCCSTRTWSEATLQLMRALQQPHKKPKRILLGGSTCSLPLPPDAFVRDAVLLPTLQFVSLFYPGGVSRETDRAGSCGEKSKTAAQEGKDAGGLSAAAGVSNTAAAIAAAGGGVASLLPVAIPLLQQLQQGCNNNSSWVASFVDFLSLLLQHWAPSATPLFVASVSAAFAAIALLQLLLQPSQLFLGNAKAASGNVQPPRASSAGAAATWEKATLPDTAGEPGAAPTSAAHAAQALLNWGVSLSVYCSSHLLNWVILERGGYAVRVGLCSKSNRTGPFRVYIHPDKCSTMHGATQLPLSPLLTGALLQSQMLVLMVLQHPERYGYSLPGKLGTLSSAINSLASAAAGGPPSVQQVQQEPSMVTGLKELQHNFHLPQDQPQPEFVAQSAAWRRLLQRQTCNLLGPSANPYTVVQEHRQQELPATPPPGVLAATAAAAAAAVRPPASAAVLPHRELLAWIHRGDGEEDCNSCRSDGELHLHWGAAAAPACLFTSAARPHAGFCCCCCLSAAACAACRRRQGDVSSSSSSNNKEKDFATAVGLCHAVCEGVAAELAAATAATAAALAAADDISPHTGGDVSAGRRELTRRLEVCSAAELLLRLTAEHHRQQAGSLTVAAATAATLSALLVVTPGGTSQAAAEPRGGLVKRRRIYCNSNHSSSKTHAATTHVDGNASPLPLRTEALCSGMVLLLLHWWPFSSGRGCSSQKHSETSVAAALPTATDTALPEGCCALLGEVLARLALDTAAPVGWCLLQLLAAAAAAVARNVASGAASGATNACTQHRGSRGADGDSSECQECSGSTAASKSNTYSEGSLHASSRFFDATFGLWLAYANAAAGNPLTGCGSQERQRKQQHQQQDQLEALLERDVALARPFILANAVADLRMAHESESSSSSTSNRSRCNLPSDRESHQNALRGSAGGSWLPAAVPSTFGRWMPLIDEHEDLLCSPLGDPGVFVAKRHTLPCHVLEYCAFASLLRSGSRQTLLDLLRLLLKASPLSGVHAAAAAAGLCCTSGHQQPREPPQQRQLSLELPSERLKLLRLNAPAPTAFSQEPAASPGVSWRGFVLGWRILGRELLLLNAPLAFVDATDGSSKDGGLGGSFGAPPCCSTCSGGESDRQWLLRMWKAIQQGFSPLAFPSGSSSESVEAPLVLLHPLQLPLDAPATCCTGVGVGSAPSAALLRALEEVKDSAIRMLLQLPAAEARVTTALFQQQKPAGKHQQHVLQWAVQNPGAVLHVCNEVLGDLQRAAPERWQQVSAGAVALHVPLHSLLPVLLHGGPHPLLVGPLLWFVLLLGLLAAAGSSSDLLLIPPRNNTGSSNASSSSEASDCPCGAAGSPVDSLADIAWSLLLIWFERTPWLLLHAFRCLKRLPRSSGHKQQQQPQVFSAGKENSGSPLPWPTLRTSFGSFCSRRSVLGRMMRLPSIFALRAPLGAGVSGGRTPLQLPFCLAESFAQLLELA
ncbi:uncharacterized protein LOC113147138 [Cyclospora cayetanensis]|uniref:Uncharacterized protein LOC113147138 n=1 Tax=Cyclospora cayetanensis TaxID=88456 RepID=A0A6P6RWX1_9EIME|nr:uncharacterized protein LOC113147138 [Cyclospora cayetanensis]